MTKFFTTDDDFEKIIKGKIKLVTEISQIKTGWTNFVFMVCTAGNGSYIFRFPRNDFFAKAMVTEIPFTKFVAKHVSTKTVELKLGRHRNRIYSIHRLVDGEVLTEVYPTLSVEQKGQLAQDIAVYLNQLQSVSEHKINILSSEFLTGLVVDNGLPSEIIPILGKLKDLEGERILSHGDFNPGNILVDNNGRLVAVLDYAFISVSCRTNDLSRLIGRLPEDFREPMLNALGYEVDKDELDLLINLWSQIDSGYIDYMRRCHPDVEV